MAAMDNLDFDRDKGEISLPTPPIPGAGEGVCALETAASRVPEIYRLFCLIFRSGKRFSFSLCGSRWRSQIHEYACEIILLSFVLNFHRIPLCECRYIFTYMIMFVFAFLSFLVNLWISTYVSFEFQQDVANHKMKAVHIELEDLVNVISFETLMSYSLPVI